MRFEADSGSRMADGRSAQLRVSRCSLLARARPEEFAVDLRLQPTATEQLV